MTPACRLPYLTPFRLLCGTVASLVAALLAGCGGGLPNAEQAADQGIFLRGNGAEPASLDPHLATGVTENHIISTLLEGLINYHPSNDNEPEPGVAERWEHDGSFRVWTFYLREDARWSNGDPVTAGDFAYSYERMLTPALGAQYVQMLYLLENGAAFHQGEITDFSQVGVEVVDDRTLRLRLTGPTPYFLSMLKHYSWYPVHPPTIEAQAGGMTDISGQWTRDNFVGNGPFILKDWKPEQFIRVTKSPTYWDAKTVQLNEIYFFPVNDYETEFRMFQSGQLHLTSTVPPNQVPVLRERNYPELFTAPYLGVYYYRFNLGVEPLDDIRIRKALAMSINREQIVSEVVRGGQEAASTFVPPGFDGYTSPEGIPYDPERARELLAEAGFPNGEGFPELTLFFNTSEGHRKIAEAIVRMWNTTLNINMVLDNADWKVFLARLDERNYEVARSAWIGDFMDPLTFLELMRTGNGNNRTNWSNADFDRLIAEGMASTSREAHYEKLRQAEAVLLEEVPVAPIYFYVKHTLVHARLQGWEPKLLDNRPMKYISFSE